MTYIRDLVQSSGAHSKNVTVKKVDESNVNKWGDATQESVEQVEVTAMVELLSGEAEEVVEGDFETGDIRLFVDGGVDSVVEGNVVVYQGKDYRIDEVLKFDQVGHISHYEARAKKV